MSGKATDRSETSSAIPEVERTRAPSNEPLWGLAALRAKREAVREHQARFAAMRERWIANNRYYYDCVKRALRFVIEPGRRVLNVRCENGFLLEAVEPARGVGVEVSEEMVDIARRRYPQFEFRQADPEDLELRETFDYILFDHVSDTVDVLRAFQRLRPACEPHTRLLIYTYNHLWEPINSVAERLRIKMPMPEQSWLSERDLREVLHLAGFEWLRTYRLILFPKWVPLLSEFMNRLLARLPILNRLCMVNLLVARPVAVPRDPKQVSVSIVVPCKNERGNVESAVQRIPVLGRHTEILFCDDKSTDGTAEEVRRVQQKYPERDIKLLDGPGVCKALNVWTGFRAAQGDVLMILDADLTVMPEELPHFLETIVQGKGEFINGSRMVYPMQKLAMKFTNMAGNKFFSMVFSYLLDQTLKDTLCGTKVLWRVDWKRIEPRLGSWGISDRWGDYELLFGAAKLHLKILDLPVHYQERIYGTTKMVRVFRNGLNMLRMCWAAFLKFKLGY